MTRQKISTEIFTAVENAPADNQGGGNVKNITTRELKIQEIFFIRLKKNRTPDEKCPLFFFEPSWARAGRRTRVPSTPGRAKKIVDLSCAGLLFMLYRYFFLSKENLKKERRKHGQRMSYLP